MPLVLLWSRQIKTRTYWKFIIIIIIIIIIMPRFVIKFKPLITLDVVYFQD